MACRVADLGPQDWEKSRMKVRQGRSSTFMLRVLSLAILAPIGIGLGPQSSAQSTLTLGPGVSYTVVATGLAGPRGLLLAPSGELYVVEQTSGSIVRITSKGRVARIATGLSDPHDLAMDAQGNFYVAETGANRVARISPDGRVATYVADLAVPVDLDFNPEGELLVCELGKGRVVAFRSPETRRIVADGLNGPHGLAFKSGTTFINEWSGNRIVKVGADGRTHAVAEVEVPVGLALGRSGDLYVAQPQVGKVSRIKPDGTRILLVEGLKLPRDPVFDAQGNLLVAESGEGRILRFTGAF